jgi:hypothetical protein
METDWKKFVEITLEYAIRVVHIQSLPEALQYVKEAGVVEDQILSGNLNWVTTRWLELRQLPPTPQSLPEQMTQHDDSLDNGAYVRTEDVPNFDREVGYLIQASCLMKYQADDLTPTAGTSIHHEDFLWVWQLPTRQFQVLRGEQLLHETLNREEEEIGYIERQDHFVMVPTARRDPTVQ